MNILIATNMFPTGEAPWYGIFVREQADSLRALGHHVEVEVHLGRASRLNYLRGIPALARRLRERDWDLIHTHHSYSTLVALAARRIAGRRIPIVMTFHESEVFHRGPADALGEDRLRKLRYSHRIKAAALRRADYVIPVQRDMLRLVLGEAEAARIPHTVIPAGIDLSAFTPEDKAAVRARLGWPAGQTIVFYPCDPRKPEKNPELARAGFERFAANQPGARLIVGGSIPYDQMADHIKASDVILVPTAYEASPTVVKEALACERPVVSTEVGDVRECYGLLPGVQICEPSPESIASCISAALAAPSPFGGRDCLHRAQLDLPQVAQRLSLVYTQLLKS